MNRIYLDYAATTPLSPAAREAMLPWLDSGNASSLYEEGRAAKDALDKSREVVSQALGCLFAEVIFTSGGTEAANLAILGAALANEDLRRNRILLSAAEHHCVLHTRELLARLGYQVDIIPVDREARINLEALDRLLNDEVLLVAAMHVNNELGTFNPIPEIAGKAHAVGALLHVDAVQSFLKPVLSPFLPTLGPETPDLVTISAHKLNGPKGVGAAYVKAGAKVKSLVGGGGQEREIRGGTENVAAVVGFGAAVQEHLDNPQAISTKARQILRDGVVSAGAVVTVPGEDCLPSHLHLRFPGISAQTLLIALDRAGISASSGAACSSGSVEPSHVMLACGYTLTEAAEGLRLTLGPQTTEDEAHEAAKRIQAIVSRIRN